MSSLIIDHPKHRGVYSQVIYFVTIATSLSFIFGHAEKTGLARLDNLRELHESLQAWLYAMDCDGFLRAMDILVGRYGWMEH